MGRGERFQLLERGSAISRQTVTEKDRRTAAPPLMTDQIFVFEPQHFPRYRSTGNVLRDRTARPVGIDDVERAKTSLACNRKDQIKAIGG